MWSLFGPVFKWLFAATGGGSVIVFITNSLGIPLWQASLIGGEIAFLIFAFGYTWRQWQKDLAGSGERLTIQSAKYGVGDDDHGKDQYRDVTTILEGYIQNNQIDVRVDNSTLKGDPFPNREKHIVVTYSAGGGEERTIIRHEHDQLVISKDSSSSAPTDSDQAFSKEIEKQARLRKQAVLALEVQQGEVKRLLSELGTAMAKLITVTKRLEETEQARKEEKEWCKEFQRRHGLWRIQQIGKECADMNLGVSVQFVDHKDVDLAKRIRWCFGERDDTFVSPWNPVDIEHIRWRQNPSKSSRIVVFSDNDRAGGIVGTFRDCELIEERMKHYPAQMLPGKQDEMLQDIAIIIFDKIAKDEN